MGWGINEARLQTNGLQALRHPDMVEWANDLEQPPLTAESQLMLTVVSA